MAKNDEPSGEGGHTVAATAVGTGLAVAAALDPAAAVLIGITGAAISPVAVQYSAAVLQHGLRGGAALWASFSRRSGKTAEDVVEQLQQRPELVPLLEQIRDAVRLSNSEPKFRALGGLLADAVDNPSEPRRRQLDPRTGVGRLRGAECDPVAAAGRTQPAAGRRR